MTAPQPPFASNSGGSPPPLGWSQPAYGVPPPPKQRRTLVTVGLTAALGIAIAALVVALVALTHSTSLPSGQTTAAQPEKTTPLPSAGNTTDADKALCNAIAPLLKRSEDQRNSFVDAGPANSPAADAALPKFVDDTKQWAEEAQRALDNDSGPPRHITRTLQRYIDDMLLYVEGIRPGRSTKYDEAAWVDASESENGPIMVCYGVGVKW